MAAKEAARKYFEAWNRRSGEAVVAAIQPGGTYEDPQTGGPLSGDAIAGYADGLFEAFPDVSFELISEAETGPEAIAAQWVMRGTHTGPMQGAPPTGGSIELPGADFITTKGGQVASVRGYFDSATIPRQLGMQVVVQPASIGPVEFGTSVYLSVGKRTRPGAFSITSLRVRSRDEMERVREYTRPILQELPGKKGFISAVTGNAGLHAFTVTAWENPDDPAQMRSGGAHQEAMDAFYGPDFSHGGVTSIWTPHRVNPLFVRCTECGEMSTTEASGSTCRAGHTLPDAPPYW